MTDYQYQIGMTHQLTETGGTKYLSDVQLWLASSVKVRYNTRLLHLAKGQFS